MLAATPRMWFRTAVSSLAPSPLAPRALTSKSWLCPRLAYEGRLRVKKKFCGAPDEASWTSEAGRVIVGMFCALTNVVLPRASVTRPNPQASTSDSATAAG